MYCKCCGINLSHYVILNDKCPGCYIILTESKDVNHCIFCGYVHDGLELDDGDRYRCVKCSGWVHPKQNNSSAHS
jgi:hypothetical protein